MELLVLGTYGAILCAAFIDVFFLTGVFFSGLFLLTVVGGLLLSGQITLLSAVPFVYFGSLCANYLNYFLGKTCAAWPIISRTLEKPQVARLRARAQNLSLQALFFFILGSRGLGVIRPFYALTLGAASVPTKRFLILEACAAFCWCLFWSLFIYFGIDYFSELFV